MKNNKGFTLVELLAVIVVLAVIMVIAGTSITNVIKKNRVDSFVSTARVIYSTLKTCVSQGLDAETCESMVDIDGNEYSFRICDAKSGTPYAISGARAAADTNPGAYVAKCVASTSTSQGAKTIYGTDPSKYIYTYALMVRADDSTFTGKFKNMNLKESIGCSTSGIINGDQWISPSNTPDQDKPRKYFSNSGFMACSSKTVVGALKAQ